MSAELCRCPTLKEAETCQRNGLSMIGRPWEVCSGNCPAERPCSKEQSDWWRAFWDGMVQGPMPIITLRSAPAPVKALCIYLGEPTGEMRECPECNGKVMVKLFACAVYGQCTTQKKIEGIACCNDNCPSYEPKKE